MESEAAVQVIESIGDLIEASKDEAEKLIEAEFAGIFARFFPACRPLSCSRLASTRP